MALERQKVTRLGCARRRSRRARTALKDVATKLAALKNAAQALSSRATWKQSQSVESSDATRVGATLMAGAGIGGQTVQVDRLASSAQRGYAFDPTTGGTLSLYYGNDPGATGAAKVDVTVAADATMQQVAAAINAKTAGARARGRRQGPRGDEQIVLSARKTGADSDFTVAPARAGLTEDATSSAAPATTSTPQYRLNGATDQSFSGPNVVENAIPGVQAHAQGRHDRARDRHRRRARARPQGDRRPRSRRSSTPTTRSSTPRARTSRRRRRRTRRATPAARGQLFGDTGLISMLASLRVADGRRSSTRPASTTSPTSASRCRRPAAAPSAPDAKAGRLVIDDAKLSGGARRRPDRGPGLSWRPSPPTPRRSSRADRRGRASSTTALKSAASGRSSASTTRSTRRTSAWTRRRSASRPSSRPWRSPLQNAQSQQAWLTGQLNALNTSS